MKTLFLMLFVLNVSLCYSQGKDGLVAASYPGSISEDPGVPSNQRTFYSKDAFEKVMAHYTKSLGTFVEISQNNYFREAIPSNDVMDYLAKHGVQLGESRVYTGVALSGKSNSSYSVTKVLDKLKSAYLMRFNNPDVEDLSSVTKHIDDAELKQTIARYEHVQWEHFPLTKQKHMDEVIYEEYVEAPENEALKEEQQLVKKMTELTTQMKYDEAGKVGDRMTKLSSRHTDAKRNWDIAMKCLQELEKNAYATKIVIDKHPSQWDLSAWK